ncbi:hypothetical protein FKM82_028920 [Ascaphus truei]
MHLHSAVTQSPHTLRMKETRVLRAAEKPAPVSCYRQMGLAQKLGTLKIHTDMSVSTRHNLPTVASWTSGPACCPVKCRKHLNKRT